MKHLDRWAGIERPYVWADVKRLQGRTKVKHTLAEDGAIRLWGLMNASPYVRALGASTGNMAVQQVKAGMQAIYCSGWQVAADANTSGHTYPDQSLYPVDSVPSLVKRINNALLRAEQIEHCEDEHADKPYRHWMAPIIADAEAGFGGPLNAYELVKALIEAGAAGIHLEDQLASAKKCGHMGGKVLVPTSQFIQSLIAARLAADVQEVPTIIIGRTDALGAQLITSDIDAKHDWKYIDHSKGRTSEGFYHLGGDPMQRAIDRACAYAPYCDLLWFETSEPNMHQAWHFADQVHLKFPGKLLAYNCSPSFNWKKKLCDVDIARFQEELSHWGYAFQFITLASFHAMSHGMFDLARGYQQRAMTAYSELQEKEFASESDGYEATKHQREVGTGYFDAIAQIISGGQSSTLAMKGSTESEQFTHGEVGSGHAEEAAAPPVAEADVQVAAEAAPEEPVQQ
jgi:isocitrate lyase